MRGRAVGEYNWNMKKGFTCTLTFIKQRSCALLAHCKSKCCGFTLIELLVVVAIIGVLASVVLASLNTARARGRDARRLADVKQIQSALEMYFNDYGYYPQRYGHTENNTGGCGGTPSWCGLKTDLAPYLSISGDPLGVVGSAAAYYYNADSGDNYQTYGFMVRFESSSNANIANNDGGYLGATYYEIGQQPSYCMNKYAGTDRYWWMGSPNVCTGGN